MTVYLTTDTHFGHKNMIPYCGRPENFNEIIFKNFQVLKEDDVLIHMGDVCIGKDSEHHANYIEPLKCRKFLVRGNHDKKSNSWYLHHGWDCVCELLGDNYYGKKIIFSHVPLDPGDLTFFDLNIHGHMHGNGHREKEFPFASVSNKHILLAIEYNNYQLYNLEKLLNEF